MIVFLVLVFALFGVIQISILLRKKKWRDLTVFCIFFVFSFVICILHASGVQLPSPIMGINAFLDRINLHF